MNEKMRSCVMGLILRQFSSPLPMAQKEPVAYLYNGVRLPKLPEWDRETYPYAAIHYMPVNKKYQLTCLSADAYYGQNSSGGINLYASNGLYSITETTQNTAWTDFEGITGDSAFAPISDSSIRTLIWTNFTAEYNGTTYMTASEPIPVYE